MANERKVNVDKFIFHKLQDEVAVLDKRLKDGKESKDKVSTKLDELRALIETSESELYAIEEELKVVGQNKLALKDRADVIKKDLKI